MENTWNTILTRFEAIVEKYPTHIALSMRQNDGSYKDINYVALKEKIYKLAFHIKNKTKSCDGQTRVALNLTKSESYIIGLFACLYANAIFTPVDSTLPELRQDFILNDIQPDLILRQEDIKAVLENRDVIDDITINTEFDLNQIAYIIYTSGSTGRPKGVIVPHQGISNVIKQQIAYFNVTAFDNTLLLLSISFDAALSDVFCSLLSGARLYIDNRPPQAVAANLEQLIADLQLNYLDIPPSMLRLLEPSIATRTLKTIVIGGEVCSFETVRKWARHVKLVNVYGPTEAIICTSMGQCDDSWDQAYIGEPLQGVDYKISADHELLIGGAQLAKGYWRNKHLTDEKFITIENKPYYKTGDKVRLDEKGRFIFCGRLDRQLKIRGQLVELNEVENTLACFSALQDVAVLAIDQKMICFYTPKQDDVDERSIIEFLNKRLPEYMISNRWVKRQSMPRTATEKIDYLNLKSEYESIAKTPQNKKEGLPLPLTDIEKKLYDLWSNILHKNDFSITDSFFKIGGDSLKAIELTLTAEKEGLALSPNMLADNNSIKELALLLEDKTVLSQQSGALDASYLKEQAALPLDIISSLKKAPKKKTIGTSQPVFFMTGATGFLGSRMLFDLLSINDEARFLCLVRAADNDTAYLRIEQAVKHHGLTLSNSMKARISPIIGDITAPNLGISDQDRQDIVKHATQIIHSAAEVNMVKSFDDLRRVNFDPVFDIMRLSIEGNIQRIHNISTLSVFVSSSSNKGRVFEHDDLQTIQKLYGGYAQTKFASEIAFHQNMFCAHIPTTSYRLGLITGDTKTGQGAKNDFLSTFIKGLGKIKSIPKGDFKNMMVDVTPVDYASKTLAHLLNRNSECLEDCYHIANSRGFSFAQILGCVAKYNVQPQTVSLENWIKEPQSQESDFDTKAANLALCRCLNEDDFERLRGMDLFQATDIVFDQQRLLKTGCAPCPTANDDLLDLYVERILA